MSGGVQTCSAHGIAQCLDMPASTMHEIIHSILHCCPYKITHYITHTKLLPTDLIRREAFALEFLTRMEVDNEWPWNILWTNEAHFHLHGFFNTQNCRICAKGKPFATASVAMHSPKVTVWYRFAASCMVGPLFFFFEEIGPVGPVTCAVNGKRYARLLRSQVIPTFQQRVCLDKTIFLRDGAPPHITKPVMQLRKRHFRNVRLISRHCPTAWFPRSPDFNPCNFWL